MSECTSNTSRVKKGVRMYPPVPVGFLRFVHEGGVELKGYYYYIQKGIRAAGYQLATSRDERLWRKPEYFRGKGDWVMRSSRMISLRRSSLSAWELEHVLER